MFIPLFAANWDDLIKIASFVVVGLYYLITMFAKKAKVQPPPPRPRPIELQPQQATVGPAAARPTADPLQTEINDFLRQAQAQRDDRDNPGKRAVGQPLTESPRRPRPKRRPVSGTIKRDAPRRPSLPAQQATPVVVEVVTAEKPRESLAELMANRKETGVFDQTSRPLSQRQQASDSEFQQHMDKVFDHKLGSLKPTALGMFEAAGAAAAVVATQAATANAAVAQSSTAPVTIHKGASDISLFLAGKKNIRDAVILSEILKRPEDRW